MTAPKPAMEASCAASSSAVDGMPSGPPGRPAHRRHARRGSPGGAVDARARQRRRRGGSRGPARHRGHRRHQRARERGETSRLHSARAGMARAASTSRPQRRRAIFTSFHLAVRAPTSSGKMEENATRGCPWTSLFSAPQRETRSGWESRSTARDRVLTGCPPSTPTAPWRACPRLAETSVAVGTFLRGHASPRRGRDSLARRGERPSSDAASTGTDACASVSFRSTASAGVAPRRPAGAWAPRLAPRAAAQGGRSEEVPAREGRRRAAFSENHLQ